MAREMKDSGIAWIGEIPIDWNKNKVFRIFDIIGSGTTPKSNNEQNFIGTIKWIQSGDINGAELFDCKTSISENAFNSSSALKIYRAPYIIIAMYGASVGNISISNIDACVNQACCVLGGRVYNLKYAYYALKTAKDYLVWKAVGGGQPNISQDTIKQLWLPDPSQKAKERIARFLDVKCAHIDSVIEKTRAAVEEYKKLKQAVITQAVTKGIRPDREMKDSGIEWFPVIPMEWTVSRVGLHYDIILGKMLCQNQLNSDYTLEPYYCAANVHFDGVSNEDLKQMWFSAAEKEQYLVNEGDLLVVEGGAGAGGSAIVVSVDKPTYVQNSVMIVRPKDSSNNCYLKYLLEFLVKEGYIDVACNKATIPHFTKDKLTNVPYLVSNEQSEIVNYLDEKTAAIDSLVQKKEQLITELEAYKKSLIYEYVTGKKEVPVHAH